MFTFKFIYTDGIDKLCAYISHQLNFNELMNFIDFWVRKAHSGKSSASPLLYWMDSDGDRFSVTNEAEYKIFTCLNEKNGILWGTSIGLTEMSITSKFNYFHSCENCNLCGASTEYTYNANGIMKCVECEGVRGNCCILVAEGSSVFEGLTKLLQNDYQEKENRKSSIAIDNEELLKMRLENFFVKSSPTTTPTPTSNHNSDLVHTNNNDENKEDLKISLKSLLEQSINPPPPHTNGLGPATKPTTTTESTVVANKTAKATGAIPKKVAKAAITIPAHVENALTIMMGMGYHNKNDWLTRLLISTNGNIGEALDQILPQKKNKIN